MKTLSLLTLLLASCVTPHDYHLQPGQKFVDGEVVGSVGVIGPTRMAYERVIPIVDITAKLLSSALTYQANC